MKGAAVDSAALFLCAPGITRDTVIARQRVGRMAAR
jgi:hypothetical protein